MSEKLKLFRALIENSGDAIHVVDPGTGRFLDVNESACRALGCTRKEHLAWTVFDVVEGIDHAVFDAAVAQAKQTGQMSLEARHRRKDGTTFPVEVNLSFVTLDREYLVVVVRDITARKQTELELRRSHEEFKDLFDNAPVGFHEVDAKGRLVRINNTELKMLGYSAGELLGQFVWKISADEEVSRRAALAKLAGETPPNGFERRFRRKDGSTFPVWINDRVLKREDGVITGIRAAIQDITEQKRAEKQLRQLSSAVEHSPVSIVITDRAGNIEYVNPKFTEVSGYTSGEVIGKNPRILKSGEMPAGDYERMWQTITTGREWRGEFHNRRKNGEFFWESASISAILDDSGEITHFVAVKEDITEVKQAREKLRLRESFLSAITENQPGLLWLKDVEGRFLMVNKAFAAACGRSDPEQVHGLTDSDFWPKELAEKYRMDDQRVMSTGNASVVEEEILIGKSHVWHETFKTPVRDQQGRVIGTTGYARDITERKLAEQQLTEAFNFNRTIISGASVGITAFKTTGQCVLANESAARTLNGTVPRLLELDFRHIASWQASGMLQLAEEVLATKEPRQGEFNFVSTFGKEVWLVSHFSHFVQNGEPHLLHVFSDITEKKKLEAQFLRAQRMESIGTLAGGIAHDLNNVLAPLLIAVQALKEKIRDEDGQQILGMLEDNVRRGASLVKQVLIFGRGVKGERVTIQVKHIAREIEEIIRETFPKSVRFKMDSAPDLWKISGDATQIQQVLLNLCVNARDAMPGGGKLSLRMENKVLDKIYAEANLDARPGNYVVISVTDTGEGMARETQDRIFEPFFTTKEHGKGTGLGLSTTLAIVKSHGGFINCYSEPGKGTTFQVYLPAGTLPGAATVVEEKPRLPRGHDELVLVVDDEEPIRKIAKHILERFGYRVLLAADGEAAVALYKARRSEIAVVITDMAMPLMDGPATIAALKAINPEVKFIGSSGLDSGNKPGAVIQNFIAKPYTVEAMLNMLRDVLSEAPGKRKASEAEAAPDGGVN